MVSRLFAGMCFFMKYGNIKVGDKIFSLLVLSIDSEKSLNNKLKRTLNCVCDCGSLISFPIYKISNKKSCGCRKGNIKYGERSSKVYGTWRGIKSRCLWSGMKNFHNYGGRGIKICDGFLDFNIFYRIVGEPPTNLHSIDRENNEMNYSCGLCSMCKENGWGLNVRWATQKQQAENRRICYNINIDGKVVTLKEACRIKNLPYKQVHERIKRGGWDIETALNTPVIYATKYRYKNIKNDTPK